LIRFFPNFGKFIQFPFNLRKSNFQGVPKIFVFADKGSSLWVRVWRLGGRRDGRDGRGRGRERMDGEGREEGRRDGRGGTGGDVKYRRRDGRDGTGRDGREGKREDQEL
jgi:hypothetical protein